MARLTPIRRTVYQPTPDDNLTPDDFLESFQGIADIIGVDATLDLIDLFGGMRLYVPRKLKSDDALLALGSPVALELVRMFGPDRIDVPLLPFTPKALTRLATVRARAGWSSAMIARSLNMSWRSATRLVGRGGVTRPKGWKPAQRISAHSDACLTFADGDGAPFRS